MSDGEIDRRRPAARNTSWLHSEPARRAGRSTPLSPVRIIEQAVTDIRENVRRNLEAYYSSESSPEPELHPNVNIEREFPFDNIDSSYTPRTPDLKLPNKRKVGSLIAENFR